MVRIVLILVGVLVIAGAGGGYILYSNSQEPEKKAKAEVKSVGRSVSVDEKTRARLERLRKISKSAPVEQALPAETNFDEFDPENSFEDGELVVVDPPANFGEVSSQLGFSVLERLDFADLDMKVLRVRIPRGQNLAAGRRTLLGRFPGLLLDANHQFDASQSRRRRQKVGRAADQLKKRKSATATGSLAQSAIGWSDIPATCGVGARIGMIDSGVDINHPALVGQNIEFKSFHSRKRRPGPSVHGTAVAAMLIGKPGPKGWGGLVPGAELKAASMFELNKIGKKVGNVIALLKSLNWLAKQKVHVINLSIAGTKYKAVNKAFKIARKKGLVMVAAAGNWGRSDKPAYPAAYSHVVAVTAVGPYQGIYKKANKGNYVEFAAPGVKMWTAIPGGGKHQSGTSFSTPYITALFGLEIAKGAKRDPKTLRSILKTGIKDLGAPGKDKTFGWGFVQKKPNC